VAAHLQGAVAAVANCGRGLPFGPSRVEPPPPQQRAFHDGGRYEATRECLAGWITASCATAAWRAAQSCFPTQPEAWSALGPHSIGNRRSRAGTSGHDGHQKRKSQASPAYGLGHWSRANAASSPTCRLPGLVALATEAIGRPRGQQWTRQRHGGEHVDRCRQLRSRVGVGNRLPQLAPPGRSRGALTASRPRRLPLYARPAAAL
jgi:hypothetical protein